MNDPKRAEMALDVICSRRSVRKFTDEPVDRDVIIKLLDAGRLAATARNQQPWHFVVVTDPKLRAELAQLAEYGKFIEQAPVCIAVLCDSTKYYLEDGSAATENILLAAEALGLGSCWVAGDKKPYADDVLKLLAVPQQIKLVSLIALGHAADSSPRAVKRDLASTVHWEHF